MTKGDIDSVRLGHDSEWMLKKAYEVGEELCRGRAVKNAVIYGEGRLHRRPGDDLAAADHRLGLGDANGEDRRLGWVDHRCEVIDAEHPKIRERESPATDVLDEKAPSSGPARQVDVPRAQSRSG